MSPVSELGNTPGECPAGTGFGSGNGQHPVNMSQKARGFPAADHGDEFPVEIGPRETSHNSLL
jgi:hypothetical protein